MRTVLQSSYSRETETAADAWGAGLMVKLDRNPRALGHLEARERATAIEAIARDANVKADDSAAGLLTAAEWAALKKICHAAPRATPPAPRMTSHNPRAVSQERPPGTEQRGSLPLPRPEPSGR